MNKQDYYNEFFELGQQKINFSFLELRLPDGLHKGNSQNGMLFTNYYQEPDLQKKD